MEVVTASIDAFNRRDLPALLDLIDPGVEWIPLSAVLDGGAYRGHDGIHRFIADADDDIEHMTVRLEEAFEIGENVVVYGAIAGRGRGSGMDLDLPLGWVLRVRNGRVDHLRAYPERNDALEAAKHAQEGARDPLGPPAPALDS